MGHKGQIKTTSAIAARAILALCATVLFSFSFAATALAGGPNHPRLAAQDITGLNHACGSAVDSIGDVYASSAGESKIKVFNPAHTELTSITNANEPCGLAVDTKGNLYVSEKATGKVVKYTPSAYPLGGAPIYSGPVTIDASGKAKGISVDPTDDRLYVAEGTRIVVYQSDGTNGQNEVQALKVATAVTSGTFTLEFQGKVTAPIAYNAPPVQVQTALEALSTIGSGNVSVEEGLEGTRSYLVAFINALGNKSLSGETGSLVVSSVGLVGGTAEVRGFGNVPGVFRGFEFNGVIGEGELTNATAVAAYTYDSNETQRHYVFAADSATNQVKVLSGTSVKSLTATASIDGKSVPNSLSCPACSTGFGFGPSGAALAADWANGHVFVYDSTHSVLDEFDSSGRYLDQTVSPSFSDAGPTGIAVLPARSSLQELQFSAGAILGFEGEQTAPLTGTIKAAQVQSALQALPSIGAGNVSVVSRGSSMLVRFTGSLANRRVGKITLTGEGRTIREPGYGPGRVYVTAGSGAGAKVLTFGPLAAPSRAALPELSREMKGSISVAVDSHGDQYVITGALIRVFNPQGTEIKVGGAGKGIEDPNHPQAVAVDSTGNVFVLDIFEGPGAERRAYYYSPSAYPPVNGTTYTRHEAPINEMNFLSAIAINPANDHVFLVGLGAVREMDSAAHGFAVLNGTFGSTLALSPGTIAIDGTTGNVYLGGNGAAWIAVVNPAGTQVLAKMNGYGSPGGHFGSSPTLAVDQSDGHVIEFQNSDGAVREYDAAGGFVGEYSFPEPQGFTITAVRTIGVAVDNSGGPGDGRVYVAYDDPKVGTPDMWAFGPLSYGEAPVEPKEFKLSVSKTGGGSGTLTSTPAGIECGLDCSEVYEEGTEVILTATPAVGSTFAGWSGGGCAGIGTCKVTMSEAKSVSAEFSTSAPSNHTLTISVTGNGSVSASEGTISGCTSAGGPSCEGEYPNGTHLTLTETPGEHTAFSGWGTPQCDESTATTCEIVVNGDEGVAVGFIDTVALTVVTEGSGTVTSSPGLISCSPFCSDEIAKGAKVTLTATPALGWTLYGWKHCDSGGVSGRHCTVAMDKAKTVTAVFTTTHVLALSKALGSGLGKVQSSPAGILCPAACSATSASYLASATVKLTPTPAKHAVFTEWLGDCTGSGACSLSMGEDHEVEAKFTAVPKELLSLAKTGDGKGTVKSKPSGINCATSCKAMSVAYYQGDAVTLTATAAKGFAFGGWNGGGCSGTGTCVVAMSEAKEVNAEFK